MHPFYRDPYQQTLTTTVVECRDQRLVLDGTLFYPNGGGQPGDTGRVTIGGREIEVVDTRYSPDRSRIEHHLAEPVEAQPGATAELALDWQRRYRHMRMHTCMHLICHVIPDPVTGGNVGADQSRAEFDLSQPVDKLELEARLNELIRAGAAVSTEWLPESVLDEQPDLVRTMSVTPPRGHGDIRMVRIDGLDYQPCGGTHLADIAEIGTVRIPSIKSKGKQNKRINIELVD